ncbi:MAG: hypothetical protein ACOC1I_04840 [Spirochaetota bacterium]
MSVLIMFKRNKQTIYDGMVYLMLNLASMSFMLLGIGFVYRALGTLALATSKLVVFALTIGAAVVVIRLLAPAGGLLERIRSKQLYLTDMALGVLVFFVLTVGYLSAITN